MAFDENFSGTITGDIAFENLTGQVKQERELDFFRRITPNYMPFI